MTEPAAVPVPRHEPEQHRFVLEVEGATAVLDYGQVDARTLDYRHTFVPTALRGGGLASQLTAYALQYALDHALTVVPSCPFVAAYIERQPRFRAVLNR